MFPTRKMRKETGVTMGKLAAAAAALLSAVVVTAAAKGAEEEPATQQKVRKKTWSLTRALDVVIL